MLNQSTSSTQIRRVGIIGGGQLAWMMADGAKALGLQLVVQTPNATDPAVAIAAETILAPIKDVTATARLATRCDVITFENEFVDLEALLGLAQRGVCFRPSLSTLGALLDKFHQRSFLHQLGLPVPKFAKFEPGMTVESLGFKFPIVLKARRHGYDGQGTFILKDTEALETVLQKLSARGQNLADAFLIEEFVPFERELAVVAARSPQGDLVIYPVVETQQEQQVCHRVIVPAKLSPAMTTEIEAITHTLLENLEAVGVFGIELFQTSEGKILVNEIAPRTHNSGHFTLDACETSQFEQNLRAVCNLPLGSPALHSQGALMVNLLGLERPQAVYLAKRRQLAEIPHAFVHWYGKESRPGRKLGHITVLLDSPARNLALKTAQTIKAIWYENPPSHCGSH